MLDFCTFTVVENHRKNVDLLSVLLRLKIFENHYDDEIQSTLVISKSKGPSDTLRDIRTSAYQICRIEENTNRTTEFNK